MAKSTNRAAIAQADEEQIPGAEETAPEAETDEVEDSDAVAEDTQVAKKNQAPGGESTIAPESLQKSPKDDPKNTLKNVPVTSKIDTGSATAEDKRKIPNAEVTGERLVVVRPLENHTCHVGHERYELIKGVEQKVPKGVAHILQNSGKAIVSG